VGKSAHTICINLHITPKSLSAKNRQKSAIPQKTFAESMSWATYPTKNIVLCLRTGQCLTNVANSDFYLSKPLYFRPHPGGGGGAGGWGKSFCICKTEQKYVFLAKTQLFFHQLSASQISGHFLSELKDVAFCT
jgi:hypothetical protein